MIKKLGSNCNIRSTSFIPVIMSSDFLEKKDLNIYNRCSHKSYQKHIYFKKNNLMNGLKVSSYSS